MPDGWMAPFVRNRGYPGISFLASHSPIALQAMRIPRGLTLLALLAPAISLTGCDDHALQQRAEEIRELSNKQDRAYINEAYLHVQRSYWTLRNHAWLGKLPDGNIVRLQSPHVTAAPLPGSAFYRGWHLQLTISSEDWRAYPAADHGEPFTVVYAITRHSATSWDIRVSAGTVTAPLRREDAVRLQDGEKGGL
jgi:hypothetical protein